MDSCQQREVRFETYMGPSFELLVHKQHLFLSLMASIHSPPSLLLFLALLQPTCRTLHLILLNQLLLVVG